jgi:hypothetical protein
VRCRSHSPAIFLMHDRMTVGFCFNYCGACLLATSPNTPMLRGHGDDLWASHHEQETPMNSLIDIKKNFLNPMREEYLLLRSKEAFYEVNTSAKLRRNADRFDVIKLRAQQSGIQQGVFLSWGFGTVFDEYFGEINKQNQPHGFGLKMYSDKSIYIGEWFNGQRYTKKRNAIWLRDDGLQYDGTWMTDMKHGFGELRYPDGMLYRGEFAKNYEHGHGYKTLPDGSRFEGRFRFGNRDGPGVLTGPDGQVEKRVFRESEVFFEKPIPQVLEMINEEEENVRLFQPESLITIAVRCVAKVMHTRPSLLPSRKLTLRLQDYLKPMVVEEFLTTVHPIGTMEFINIGPSFGFLSKSTISLKHVKFKNYDAESFIYLTSGNSALSILEVVNNRLDPSSLDQLGKRIANGTWPKLETLDLSFNKIDAVNLKNIITALNGTPHIKVVRFAGCGITANGAQTLSKYAWRCLFCFPLVKIAS